MSEVPKKRIRVAKYPHEKVGLPALRPDFDYSLLRTDIERERTASRSYTATAADKDLGNLLVLTDLPDSARYHLSGSYKLAGFQAQLYATLTQGPVSIIESGISVCAH